MPGRLTRPYPAKADLEEILQNLPESKTFATESVTCGDHLRSNRPQGKSKYQKKKDSLFSIGRPSKRADPPEIQWTGHHGNRFQDREDLGRVAPERVENARYHDRRQPGHADQASYRFPSSCPASRSCSPAGPGPGPPGSPSSPAPSGRFEEHAVNGTAWEFRRSIA
jgi:hypothetical protein